MPRTQYTFTFRNAEPGAAVTFSADVYSSPADQTADGPALALDASRTVAVWADVSELTATWVDASGASIEAEASVAVPVVVETGGVAGASPAPSGGSTPGAIMVRKFPFAFNTPGLNAGHDTGYSPAIGDVILDAWIEVQTAWDGTTPLADFGQFLGGTGGWFSFWTGAVPVDSVDAQVLDDWYGQSFSATFPPSSLFQSWLQTSYAQITHLSLNRSLPTDALKASHPISIVVSQDGSKGGASPGATQGAGVLYLVTCTPA